MIPRNQLLKLSIAAAVILGAAIWLSSRSNKSDIPKSAGSKVLPALSGKLNDINEIRIVKAGNTPFVTLKRSGGADQKDSWQVMERGGYPADFSKVRELLLKLSELEVVEEKTSNPESYPALGVEDVKSDKATGKSIELLGVTPPIGLILGKSTYHSSNYVRVAGNEKSVLAKPQITIYDGPGVWLNRSLIDFPEERVQEVRLTNVPKTSYIVTRASRDQHDFEVPKLPKGKKLTSAGAPGAIPSALGNLGFDDVRPLEKDEDWSKDALSEYRFFDGTVIAVMGRKIAKEKPEEKKDSENTVSNFGDNGDKHWVRFAVSFDEAQYQRFKQAAAGKDAAADKKDAQKPAAGSMPTIEPDQKAAAAAAATGPDATRSEAAKLNERVKNWVFQIPGYKYDNLFKPLEELLEK